MNPKAGTRVVVTGLGAVTPVGVTWNETWQGLCAGRSGIGALSRFDPRDMRSRIAGEVRGLSAGAWLDERTASRLARYEIFAYCAAREALAQAGVLDCGVDPQRVGVSIGTAAGGVENLEQQQDRMRERGLRSISPLGVPQFLANSAGAHVAQKLGFEGPSMASLSACASGGHALALGLDWLRAGRADVVLAGGAEAAITPLTVGGFCAMQALSLRNDAPTAASRPFDQARDGFVIAEGAAMVVLETLEHAQRRNARPLAEFRGAGLCTEIHDYVRPHPEGRGYSRAMSHALLDAACEAEEIQVLYAHATSTPLGDIAEAIAIRQTFGLHVARMPVTAIKSMTGHLLGAAGALQAVAAVQSLLEQSCPPTLNLENPVPECAGLDLVVGPKRSLEVSGALVNAFGFGGHNVAMVFGKL